MSHHDTAAADVNPAGWHRPIAMVYDNADTLTLKEAAIVLRYGPEAAPRSGTYIVEASSPSGAQAKDTLHVSIAPDPSGNNLQETRLPYRTNVRLAEEGEYIFTVTPPEGTNDIWNVAIDFRKLQ